MVYAFIIHTLVPGTCRILYSTFFSQGTSDEADTNHEESDNDPKENLNTPSTAPPHSSSPIDEEDIRAQRKKWVLHIAHAIRSEYSFRTTGTRVSYEPELLSLQNEGILPEFELGFFRTPPLIEARREELVSGRPPQDSSHGPPPGSQQLKKDKVVVWLGALNLGFALVVEKIENRMLAENVLKLLIRYLHEHVKIFTQPSEAILKADQVALVIRQFLPGGVLLPMNHRVIRQFERELDNDIKQQ